MGLFRASGINLGSILDPGGPHVQDSTILGDTLFGARLDQFSTSFHFCMERNEAECRFDGLCSGGFLINFEIIFGSLLEVKNGLKCNK